VCTVSNSFAIHGIFERGRVVAFDPTLERRIRELCAQAIAAQDTEELWLVLSELREALRLHVEQLKNMVDDYPFAPVDVGDSAA